MSEKLQEALKDALKLSLRQKKRPRTRAAADKREAAFRELLSKAEAVLADRDHWRSATTWCEAYVPPSTDIDGELRAAIAAARAVVGEG